MQALDHVGQANAEDIIRVVVRKALAGDLAAAGIILGRCWVAPKGRPVQLDLPPLTTAAGLPGALAAVIQSVGSGVLTTSEGADLAGLLELQRKAIETATIEPLLALLQARVNGTAAA